MFTRFTVVNEQSDPHLNNGMRWVRSKQIRARCSHDTLSTCQFLRHKSYNTMAEPGLKPRHADSGVCALNHINKQKQHTMLKVMTKVVEGCWGDKESILISIYGHREECQKGFSKTNFLEG